MSLKTYDVVQGEEAWIALRRGMLTASTVGHFLEVVTLGADEYDCPRCEAVANDPCVSIAKGSAGTPIQTMHKERGEVAAVAGVTRVRPTLIAPDDRLLLLLVSERITGMSDDYETFVSRDMERGQLDEPLAREVYAEHFAAGAPVTTTGLLVRDDHGFRLGASPDALVGDDGGLEIKCPRMKEHVRTHLVGEVPARYMAQIQASLLVSGREWWDFMSHFGGLPPYVKRVYPDAEWAAAIVAAASAFEQQAAEMTDAFDVATRGLPSTEPRIDYADIQVA